MPEIPAFDGRPLPERADVVIVGGGYTGTVAALQLARGGASVTLLERHSLGWGASTRNGGIFHPGLKWSRAQLHKRHGPELGGRLFRDGVDAFFTAERFVLDEGFDCDYRRSGLAILAWSKGQLDDLDEELQELRDAGLHGRSYRGAEIHQEIGSDAYPGGIAIEESGMIHPGRYMAGIVSAAVTAGVDFHTGTPAERIEHDGVSRVVHTSRGAVRAGAVLIATNGYSDGLVPWIGQRVMPIGSYIIATEPMSEELAASISPRGRCFFDAKNFLYYWHINAERRLIFGGRASFRRTSVDQTASILRAALAMVHPQAAHLRVEHAWGGKVAFTFDRLPHLGERDGIHYALGYCGSGLALGTTFGLRMARILGRSTEVADQPLAFERTSFPAAPVVPGAYRAGKPWFLPAAGEWLRLEDRWRRRGTPPVGDRS
jgi:glycine/D-amino acid oxidase-like deaminating enzyme